MLKRVKIFFVGLSALSALFTTSAADAATRVGYYTLVVQAGTAVTMGDAVATIPITVNNLATSSATIAYVRLDFDASGHNVSLASSAPAGWTIAEIKNAGAGQTYIIYTTSTNRIAVGGSQTFTVTLTGTNDNNIPASAADQTVAILDTGSNTVLTVNAANSNYFDRNATGNADTWQRKSLFTTITATPYSVGGGDTIAIIMTVMNRSTATQATVRPTTANLAVTAVGSAAGTPASGPAPASVASLAAGASTTFQWLYTASGSGSLYFCDSATASAGSATSKTACSNTVAVGDFTAYLAVSPAAIVSGQEVTVIMTLTNNGAAAVQNLSPTLTPPAGSAYVSGPTPGSIGKVNPGASSTFRWQYTLTGNTGDTFSFSGHATDKNGVNSSPFPAVSNLVEIVRYDVTATPDNVGSGSTNVTLTFTIVNNAGYGLQQILITSPDTGFVYSSAAGGCATAWGVGTGGSPTAINYETNSDYVSPSGGACDFSVTYSIVPTVTANTDYLFRIDLWDTLTPKNKGPRASLGEIVKITKYSVTLTATPTAINPNCTSTITATVMPDPGDGSIVSFVETAGGLDPHVATTTAASAMSILTGPATYDPLVTSATVTATFQDAVGSVQVDFLNGTACTTGVRILDWMEVIR